MVRVKICGITNLEDARAAAHLGADALGFVFAQSPRQVTPEQAQEIIAALPPFILTGGVFVNEGLAEVKRIREQCGLDFLQLHGEEDEAYVAALGPRVIKALPGEGDLSAHAQSYAGATLLLDTPDPIQRGGTGKTFAWEKAKTLASQRRVILAGGLNPENVESAINTLHPYAVDVSSGVETAPGRKDHVKIASFISRAKRISG